MTTTMSPASSLLLAKAKKLRDYAGQIEFRLAQLRDEEKAARDAGNEKDAARLEALVNHEQAFMVHFTHAARDLEERAR